MGNDYLKQFWSFKKVGRIPFLPMVCSMAARIQSIPIKDMLTNSTKMAVALQKAQKLFGYDGIFNIVDSTLEAEACGCQINWSGECEMPLVDSHPLGEGKSIENLGTTGFEACGRIPTVLEVTKRLQMVLGNKTDIIGTVTGPLALSRHLAGEAFVEHLKNNFSEAYGTIRYANTIIIRLCKLYCENKIDGILICDPLISELNAETIELIRPFYRTLYNIVNFFNIYLIISVGSPQAETLDPTFNLDANGFIVSGISEVNNIFEVAAGKGKHLGYGIPHADLMGPTDRLRELVATSIPKGEKGFFFTTDGPVPYETPVENMHELMNMLRPALRS